jgi:hypothetical protein
MKRIFNKLNVDLVYTNLKKVIMESLEYPDYVKYFRTGQIVVIQFN